MLCREGGEEVVHLGLQSLTLEVQPGNKDRMELIFFKFKVFIIIPLTQHTNIFNINVSRSARGYQ